MKHWTLSLKQVLTHKHHRTALFASFTTIRNLAYSLGMFALGIISTSTFLIINGAYQLLLSLMRILNVISYSRLQHGRSHNRVTIVKATGYLLILLGISYALINGYFYLTKPVEEVSKHSMLLTATIAFVKLGSSLWGYCSNRHSTESEVVNIRLLSLVDALVSIVTTQRVILTFVEGSTSAVSSTPFFGLGVSGLFMLIGLYMIYRRS